MCRIEAAQERIYARFALQVITARCIPKSRSMKLPERAAWVWSIPTPNLTWCLESLGLQDVSSAEGTLRQRCSNFRGMVRVRPRPMILLTMSRNLLVESVYSSLVTSHLGVVPDETDRLRTRFDAAAVHSPPAGGFSGRQRLTRGPVV